MSDFKVFFTNAKGARLYQSGEFYSDQSKPLPEWFFTSLDDAQEFAREFLKKRPLDEAVIESSELENNRQIMYGEKEQRDEAYQDVENKRRHMEKNAKLFGYSVWGGVVVSIAVLIYLVL